MDKPFVISSPGCRRSPALHELPQALPTTRKARHDCPEWDPEHLRDLKIGKIFNANEQQNAALFLRQALHRAHHVAQLHTVLLVALLSKDRFLYLLNRHGGAAYPLATDSTDEKIVHDCKQPRAQISIFAAGMQMIECSSKAIMNEIVGFLPVPQQDHGIASQRGDAGFHSRQIRHSCHFASRQYGMRGQLGLHSGNPLCDSEMADASGGGLFQVRVWLARFSATRVVDWCQLRLSVMPPTGRHVTTPSVQGHVAASAGYKPADLEFINRMVRDFMFVAANNWQTS